MVFSGFQLSLFFILNLLMKISIINAEIYKACLIQFRNFKAVHPCMRRPLAAPIFKDLKFFLGCRSQDFHTPVIKIPDRPPDPQFHCFSPGGIPKTNSLDLSSYNDFPLNIHFPEKGEENGRDGSILIITSTMNLRHPRFPLLKESGQR